MLKINIKNNQASGKLAVGGKIRHCYRAVSRSSPKTLFSRAASFRAAVLVVISAVLVPCGARKAQVWSDLTYANGMNLKIIEGAFTAASSTVPAGVVTATGVGRNFPPAKIGGGNFIYVTSGGWNNVFSGTNYDGKNYFGIAGIDGFDAGADFLTPPALPARMAYDLDSKADDGLPQSGRITAQYTNYVPQWAGSPSIVSISPFTTAKAGSAMACFDNNNTAGAAQQYSLGQNRGDGANCALWFQFQ